MLTGKMLKRCMSSKSWSKKVVKWRKVYCYGCEYMKDIDVPCKLGLPDKYICQNFMCPNHTNPMKVTRLLSKKVKNSRT